MQKIYLLIMLNFLLSIVFASSISETDNYWKQESFDSLNPYVVNFPIGRLYKSELIIGYAGFCSSLNAYQNISTIILEDDYCENEQDVDCLKDNVNSALIQSQEKCEASLNSLQTFYQVANLSLNKNLVDAVENDEIGSFEYLINNNIKNLFFWASGFGGDVVEYYFYEEYIKNAKDSADYGLKALVKTEEIWEKEKQDYEGVVADLRTFGMCDEDYPYFDEKRNICEMEISKPQEFKELVKQIHNKEWIVNGSFYVEDIKLLFKNASWLSNKTAHYKDIKDQIEEEYLEKMRKANQVLEKCQQVKEFLKEQGINKQRPSFLTNGGIYSIEEQGYGSSSYYSDYIELNNVCEEIKNIVKKEQGNEKKAIAILELQTIDTMQEQVQQLNKSCIDNIQNEITYTGNLCEEIARELEKKGLEFERINGGLTFGDKLDNNLACIQTNLAKIKQTNLNKETKKLEYLIKAFSYLDEEDDTGCYQNLNYIKDNLDSIDFIYMNNEINRCDEILQSIFSLKQAIRNDECQQLQQQAQTVRALCKLTCSYTDALEFLKSEKAFESSKQVCLNNIKKNAGNLIEIKEYEKYAMCNQDYTVSLDLMFNEYPGNLTLNTEIKTNYTDIKVINQSNGAFVDVSGNTLQIFLLDSFKPGSIASLSANKKAVGCALEEKKQIDANANLVKTEYILKINKFSGKRLLLPFDTDVDYQQVPCGYIANDGADYLVTDGFNSCQIKAEKYSFDLFNISKNINIEQQNDSILYTITFDIKSSENIDSIDLLVGCFTNVKTSFARDSSFIKLNIFSAQDCDYGKMYYVKTGKIYKNLGKTIIVKIGVENQTVETSLKQYASLLLKKQCVNETYVNNVIKENEENAYNLLIKEEQRASKRYEAYLKTRMKLKKMLEKMNKFIGSENAYYIRYSENISEKILYVQELINNLTCMNQKQIEILSKDIGSVPDICTLARFMKIKNINKYGCMDIDKRNKKQECEKGAYKEVIAKCNELLPKLKMQYQGLKIDETSKSMYSYINKRCEQIQGCSKCKAECSETTISNVEKMMTMANSHINKLKEQAQSLIGTLAKKIKQGKQAYANDLKRAQQYYDAGMYSQAIKTSDSALSKIANKDYKKQEKEEKDYKLQIAIGTAVLFIIFLIVFLLKQKKNKRQRKRISKE